MILDPDVAELLEGPPARPAPPDHRATFADAYEPGVSERALVAVQRERLAEAGQLPAAAIFVPSLDDDVFSYAIVWGSRSGEPQGIAAAPAPVDDLAERCFRATWYGLRVLEPRSFIDMAVA